jgi:predicted alpha/beta-hydrolase family hydrolase
VTEERIRIDTPKGEVSGAWSRAGQMRAVVVVAHGAGSGMDHPLLVGFTDTLNEAAIATLRFNFPYMEAGRRSPGKPEDAIGAWQAAFGEAIQRADGKQVWAAGKSYGGRMASMAVADDLPAAGLVFLGYPLHPPGKPDQVRDAHLDRISVPMLFLQGTADPFAREDLITGVTDRLGRWAVLHRVEGGDHSFNVRGTKRSPAEVGRMLGSVAARFIRHHP